MPLPDAAKELDIRHLAGGDGIVRQRLDDVQVGKAEALELAHRQPEGRCRVAVGNVVERIGRCKSHADAVAAPFANQNFGRLDQESRAIDRAAAITVSALIGLVAQKLIDQVAVGAVQFDAIEAGLFGGDRGVAIIVHDAGDFVRLERARHDEGLHALGCHRLARRLQGRGRRPARAPPGCSEGCEIRPTCQSCA